MFFWFGFVFTRAIIMDMTGTLKNSDDEYRNSRFPIIIFKHLRKEQVFSILIYFYYLLWGTWALYSLSMKI